VPWPARRAFFALVPAVLVGAVAGAAGVRAPLALVPAPVPRHGWLITRMPRRVGRAALVSLGRGANASEAVAGPGVVLAGTVSATLAAMTGALA